MSGGIRPLHSGCTKTKDSYKNHYVEPLLPPKATLKIIYKNPNYQNNVHVFFHHDNTCQNESMRILGQINYENSKGITKNEINVFLPTNKQIGISARQFHFTKDNQVQNAFPFKLSVCQPLVNFNPKENESYIVEVSHCIATVYSHNEIIASSQTESDCKISTENSEVFQLIKK